MWCIAVIRVSNVIHITALIGVFNVIYVTVLQSLWCPHIACQLSQLMTTIPYSTFRSIDDEDRQ